MAFCVDLKKIKETALYAQYAYYSFENDIGILEIRKSDGHIKEIDPVKQDELGRIFERAARVLARHWIKGEYPEKTFWAS